MNCIELGTKNNHANNFSFEELDLPKMILFGDKLIELDESMFTSGLCPECKEIGYCKKLKINV